MAAVPDRFSAPVPEASKVAPPMVPAKLIARSLLCPLPVYLRVAPVASLPMAMVPLLTVVGPPRLLLAVPMLAMVLKVSVPAWTVVAPV